MTLGHVLQSDAALTLIGGLLGLAWTAFRSSDLLRNARNRRFERALQALEAGVELTYRTYVQAIKEAKADGKLTTEEAREARRRARDAAIEFGRAQGLNVLDELGPAYVDLWIAKLVKRLKAK
ncbi:MAG TPA: hypothetical protein P5318_06455 [Candidatus Hydrogenedentes bacterium]|nr:hypothetical protein [Candidatus Hydrogenedentota bacterium]HPC15838.1 hypothetical protein [Candidatus Hydrogenedentota bacterium]HRT19753.1 hypothetical protein [Candidatus Hydrogenedentota bacterium]HRT64527.1 hypothetical protein [Candidatus Hydrogenedentota bacterium]